MAKSPTKRKQRVKADPTTEANVNQAINAAVNYVKSWKRNELITLASNPPKNTLPVCIPVKRDAYVIGRHGLKKDNGLWTLHTQDYNESHEFVYRSSAVVYSICSQTGRKKLAQEILNSNQEILRLQRRLQEFQYLFDKARRKKDKDYWRLDHYTIMMESAEFAVIDAKNELEKSINLAKYFKIWE